MEQRLEAGCVVFRFFLASRSRFDVPRIFPYVDDTASHDDRKITDVRQRAYVYSDGSTLRLWKR